MDYSEKSLAMHARHHGKVAIVSKVPVTNRDELSTAYTPGVAAPCLAIHAHPEDVYKYTAKGNLVAVVSDGTAVLGLGNIGKSSRPSNILPRPSERSTWRTSPVPAASKSNSAWKRSWTSPSSTTISTERQSPSQPH